MGKQLHLARDVQVVFTSEEKEIIIVAPTEYMVPTIVEMMSRSLVLGRALGSEVQKNSVATLEKDKVELVESSSSLKTSREGDGCPGRGVVSSQG